MDQLDLCELGCHRSEAAVAGQIPYSYLFWFSHVLPAALPHQDRQPGFNIANTAS